VLGLFIFLGLGTGGLLLLLIALPPEIPDRRSGQIGAGFDLSLSITDAKPSSGTSSVLQETWEDNNTVTLHRSRYLEKARRDKRIVGIYLNGSRSSEATGTVCHAQGSAGSLERFRAAGKTILAYMNWRNEIIT